MLQLLLVILASVSICTHGWILRTRTNHQLGFLSYRLNSLKPRKIHDSCLLMKGEALGKDSILISRNANSFIEDQEYAQLEAVVNAKDVKVFTNSLRAYVDRCNFGNAKKIKASSHGLRVITRKSLSLIPSMSAISLVETIFSLGTLNKQLSLTDGSFIELVNASIQVMHQLVLKQPQTLSAKSLCKYLTGIVRLQTSWKDMQKEKFIAVISCQYALSELTSQGISNYIWSLGKLEIPIRAIPPSTRTLLLQMFHSVASDINDQGISNILIGFYKLGLTWDE